MMEYRYQASVASSNGAITLGHFKNINDAIASLSVQLEYYTTGTSGEIIDVDSLKIKYRTKKAAVE